MNRESTIAVYGLKDGKDNIRYDQAQYWARETDVSVSRAFEGLVDLERKGYIELVEENGQPKVIRKQNAVRI